MGPLDDYGDCARVRKCDYADKSIPKCFFLFGGEESTSLHVTTEGN